MLAIVQNHIYSGKFHDCYSEHLGLTSHQMGKLIRTKWDCLNYGGEWITPDFNYDKIGRSFVTLTSLSSNEGWSQVLFSAIDVSEIDRVNIREEQKYFGSIFTVVVLFIISLLFLNLFIGVVIETFNR